MGTTRGAADDLAREVAAETPATFGLERLSLTQLAARTALEPLLTEGVVPGTPLGAEAVAARAAFELNGQQQLEYFHPVAGLPGFARAAARTLRELRLAGIDGRRLAGLSGAGRDLSRLLEAFAGAFADAASVDRAGLFAAAVRGARARPAALHLLLLDVPLEHRAEQAFVEAILDSAARVSATLPAADHRSLAFLSARGAAVDERHDEGRGDLACVRRYLFTPHAPAPRELDGSLEFFSAPGEAREAIEIARRALDAARGGVRFDEMAVIVRSPDSYFGHLDHAFRRAGIPAWFGRGTRRPHPAGRAFLALLACAAERLSAERFAEYLSFGQVPSPGSVQEPWAASADEVVDRLPLAGSDEQEAALASAEREVIDADAPIVAGTLRAPWRWEKLLVEASVIGGGPDRWIRRLDGKARELERQRDEALREDGPDSARAQGLSQVLDQLDRLRGFAVPLVTRLAAWPGRASWGEWLDRFGELAPSVLRTPAPVLRVLADLRPMARVGPIDLEEARRVLADRLLTLEAEPPARRFGRVFVGAPDELRGRQFRIVFVPGLAERLFPRPPREDPLLLDVARRRLDEALSTERERLAGERLLLQLAAGAAAERLVISYPRIELGEARARVPSFYALDLLRAATGRVIDHETLEERARRAGDASLAWPAPSRPETAIDEQEYDLSLLRLLLDAPDRTAVRGHAHYLLKLNDCLRRSVVDRWSRAQPRWSTGDGLTRVTAETVRALSDARLYARAYSLSALQRFGACPYQFFLAAVHRLHPFERPAAIQHLDPLARGSLFHEIQAELLHRLREASRLPVTPDTLDEARAMLDAVAGELCARAHDELVPAVERVWEDETASMRRDLGLWLERLARDGAEWVPVHFEFAFGSVPGRRDPASVADPVALSGGFRLRGAVDLIERHRTTGLLRVTDHKTGRPPDQLDALVVGGGRVLQPVLYGMAAEAALGAPVAAGRLFYSTAAAGFRVHEISLTDAARGAALEVLQVIDRAIERGFLAAAPAADACEWCDFRPVCGPGVHRRVRRKPPDPDLEAVRRLL